MTVKGKLGVPESDPPAPRTTGASLWLKRSALLYLFLSGIALIAMAFVDRVWLATAWGIVPRWWLIPLGALIAAPIAWRRLWPWVGVVAAGLLFSVLANGIRFNTCSGEHDLRVVSYNVGNKNWVADPVVVRALAARAEVIVLQECRPRFKKSWTPPKGYKLWDTGNLCLITSLEVERVFEHERGKFWLRDGSESILVADLKTPHGPLRVVGVHLATIRRALIKAAKGEAGIAEALRDNTAVRFRESEVAAEYARRAKGDVIVAGDFNLPVESAIFRQFWDAYGNAFELCGTGLGWTKMTRVHGVRIDHVLASSGLHCVGAHVPTDGYSDHRAVWTKFAFAD